MPQERAKRVVEAVQKDLRPDTEEQERCKPA
jgi:hypothetical protein